MPLQFPAAWRYGTPGELQQQTVGAFHDLIQTIASQGASWAILELFKRRFSPGSSTSSSESWAASDLRNAMSYAAGNAPTFIASFWAGCEEVSESHPEIGLPDAVVLNQLLVKHGVPYEIRLPHLVVRGAQTPVEVQASELSLDGRARDLIQNSLSEADRLLSENRPRAAVQEILWLLETVSTAFKGLESGEGTVEGKYFNDIIRDLRNHNRGTALREILGWISKLHGFLSSPLGGGIRHGTEIDQNTLPTIDQARLYCNLTRSYINYLLSELAHDRQG